MCNAMQYKVEDFLNLLFRPAAKLELRAIKLGGGVTGRAFVDNPYDAVKFGLRYGRDAEIYMGVAPRFGDKDYAPIKVLWVDVDFKTHGEHASRADIAFLDLEPSVVVNSGGGLHLYWILDEDLPNADPKPQLRWLAGQIAGGDLASAEHAHVLRVPGTMNHKYSPARQVTIEKFRPDLTYEPWEFQQEEHLATTTVAPGYSGSTAGMAAIALAKERMKDWPPAIQGMRGDEHTFATACMLVRDLGLSEEDAFEAMVEWNERCIPPWNDAELRKKIRGAMLYGKGQVGSDDPTSDFMGLPGDDGANIEPKETKFDKLNREYKAVDDAGELRVYKKVWDESLSRYKWQRYRRLAFLEVCNSVLQLPLVKFGQTAKGEDKHIPMAQFWIDHWRKKTTYSGIGMRPECDSEQTPDNILNMWHGFSVVEREGDWSKVKELTREILCNGDLASYEYVMNWMARAIQIPWEPGKTAIVFKGRKGAGKSTLGNLFHKLFGQHGMHITGRDQFIGRFNAHLRDCVALFADEAFWAGDKQGEGALKAFITEDSLAFERKGVDPDMGRNYLHVIMASNMDWVVPASMDERRFAVFQVSDDTRSQAWWAPLFNKTEIRNTILPAMLWELKRRDIRNFNVFDVPMTEALIEQKAHSMDPIASWFLKCAENNWLDFGSPEQQLDGTWYSTEEVFQSYLRDSDNRNTRTRVNESALGMLLKKYVPKLRKKKIMLEGSRKYFYALPEPSECIDHIEKLLGIGA